MIKNEDVITGRAFKKNIEKELSVSEVVIFGSRARGDAAVDSDLDVLVVLDDVPDAFVNGKEKVYDVAWETGLEYHVVISTIVVTHWDITQTAFRSSPLLRSIRKEGVIV